MIYDNGLMGFGAAGDPLPDSALNYKIPVPDSTPTGTGSGVLDWLVAAGNTVKNTVDKFAPTVKTGIDIANQLKTQGSSSYGSGGMSTNQQYYPAPAPAGMSNGTKLALGAGAAALTLGVLATVMKKKKKK